MGRQTQDHSQKMAPKSDLTVWWLVEELRVQGWQPPEEVKNLISLSIQLVFYV